ncbi:hypothetical protein HK100_001252, partial [Physocladia obscura]
MNNPLTHAKYPYMTDPTAQLEHAVSLFQYNLRKSKNIYLKATLATDDDIDAKILGFVVWDDPEAVSIKETFTQSEIEQDRVFRKKLMDGADMTLMQSMAEEHDAAESKVNGKHWYLGNLVVAKDAQGMGVGSALLDWGLQKADVANLP